MKDKDVFRLIDKYLEGKGTEAEKAALETWYLKLTEESVDAMPEPNYSTLETEMFSAIDDQIINKVQPKVIRFNTVKYVAAAIILCVLGAGLFLYVNQNKIELGSGIQNANNIKPGGNKAYLTLADGKRIDLNDAHVGKLADQTGIVITKSEDGQLIYTIGNQETGTEMQYNTIETPKGGQYQVNLPDGSKVWLNAESSLKYPVSFTSQKERRVELSGEGYFEVAKNAAMPFRVVGNKQTVEVLGTHFNINSYSDEPVVKTTLLEGSVKVIGKGTTGTKTIKPGEQAVLDGAVMSVSVADADADVDWKNGDFIFRDENIQSIMRKISRWYDVEVVYNDNNFNSGFGGTISRSKNIAAVLHVLEETGGVHFKLEGRRVTVMK